ncbi:ABC transporter ATP-binding protein [Rhizobiaceae bacterium BDR2-2]|uniref:ABC transporter ATP-binding protein n=1 Tax=Ectorhizobium quercum TaxID=2965071 RepID=A0AAE3N3X1_9HYPH|nr:ABC transporter ATP-binding protein [Ectorhizobium quercum]MCX8999741.1 ABC transporter ATP-binding protein [Ectorhizobium quercum]
MNDILSNPSVEARMLDVDYGTRPVVRGVDLVIVPGTVTTLVGPNGSGKSTLLKALSRLLAPAAGSVLLEGRDIRDLRTREIARKLSILPQGPVVPEGVTVRELVAYGRAPHQGILGIRSRDDIEAVDRALAMTRIGALADQPVDALSGGQRQRVWIAMTVAQETQVMFLDEPTTYLDIAHQIDVLDLLLTLNRRHGRTVVMVLHDLNLAARYSDRMIVLREGHIIADGSPVSILTPQVLRDAFEIEADIRQDTVSGCPWFIPLATLTERKEDRP